MKEDIVERLLTVICLTVLTLILLAGEIGGLLYLMKILGIK